MKKNNMIRFLLCMILSVAMLATMGLSVAAAPEDGLVVDNDPTIGEEGAEGTEPVEPEGYVPEEGYKMVASNGGITMYYEDADAHFYLRDDVSGKEWHSTGDIKGDNVSKGLIKTVIRSQIIVSYISESEKSTLEYARELNSQSDCIGESIEGVRDCVQVKEIPNQGIEVSYQFPAIGATVPVRYTLVDGKLVAAVILKKDGKPAIKEEGVVNDNGTKDEFMIVDINLLPAFGAGSTGKKKVEERDTGYLFIPDGSGALIDFSSNLLDASYKGMVYGDDMSIVPEERMTYTESIRLPVFGTAITTGGMQEAMMGIITKGDTTASISVINSHEKCGFDAVSPIFHYRVMQSQYNLFNKRKVNDISQPTNTTDAYEVQYSFLSGDQANYIGMATEYRNYLIKNKGLKVQVTNPTFHLNAVGAFEQPASFLGLIPYTDAVSLTTYEQCQTIVESLKKAGISNITLRYTGWSNNGIENVKIPKGATALGVLGGKKGLQALQSYTDDKDIAFYPEVDLITFQKNGAGVNINKHAVRSVFGKTTYRAKYMLSTTVKELNSSVTALLSPEQFEKVGGRYLTSLKDNGFKAVNLSTMGNYSYSNFYEKNQQYRSQFGEYVEKMLKSYRDGGVKMAFSNANAYVLPYAALVTDVPTHSSGYDLFTCDVPFYQMVLHGYVPYTTEALAQTADPEAAYLAAVETGTELSYIGIYEESSVLFDTAYDYMYGSNYLLWQEKAAGQYAKYMPLLTKICKATIVDHKQVEGYDAYLTVYSDGTRVVVNYDDEKIPAGTIGNDKDIESRDWMEVSVA